MVLVEDHPTFRFGLRGTGWSAEPDLAVDRRGGPRLEALEELIVDPPPDVAVVDLNLPGIDGMSS